MSSNYNGLIALVAGLLFSPLSGASAQGSAVGKTLAFISDDAAWGDVLLKTESCSIPGESSCSRLNSVAAPIAPQAKNTAALTPLESFSHDSSPHGNNPDEIASVIAPALDKLSKTNAATISPIEKIAAKSLLKVSPTIHGGNGTFITLPAGVGRMNQATKQTIHALSKQDGQ
jgi:hypothetical protein